MLVKLGENSDMRTLAMYLPQYHRIAENDMWWGDGFTEWVTVRGAEPVYKNHYQPREPLNDNYYNLLNRSVMEYQAKLAKKMRIDGFCFYHYWFKDGRKILEKPAENLLKWKDIDMPFCFYWANESWVRSWSKVEGGNAWAAKYEKDREISDGRAVLLEQEYGKLKEWIEHFDYMLPFFKDKRYIKSNGKPLVLIYRPEKIYCLDKMLECWKNRAAKAGLPGLYIVVANNVDKEWANVDAYLLHEPTNVNEVIFYNEKKTNRYKKVVNGVNTYSYDDIWREILIQRKPKNKTVFMSGCVGFDTTPRHGKSGMIFTGQTPEKFYRYLKLLMLKSLIRKNEFVFINAWNEWGEGMYLEPDKVTGYKYLNAVRKVREDTEKFC